MRAEEQLSLTGELARFVTSLSPERLPAEVLDDARWRLVDTVGVALAGSRMDYAPAVIDVIRAMGGRAEATVIGAGDRLPAASAGFVNGAFAHGPDYDDTHSIAMVHIGCLAVPAAFAMAERTGARGNEFLAALVAGAEVGLRIAAAVPHRFHARGYHATGVVGPFVAATSAGRLLRLTSEQLGNALGLAGSQADGVMQGLHDGSWVKRLHPAYGAQSGIMAALLAQRGFTGPREVLEGAAGLYRTFLHDDEAVIDPGLVLAGLGTEWLLPKTTFKPYPNGAWNHSTMDAVRMIMDRERLLHTDIELVVSTVPEPCSVVFEPREVKIHPQTPYHMKFSLPYSVAILAVLGRVAIDDYTEAVLGNPEIAGLASRIHCEADPAMSPEGFPARVRLQTRDGRTLLQDVPAQRGGPGNPMAIEDHRTKFRSNAEMSLGPERADALLRSLERVAEAPNLTEIAELLAPPR